jgi:hypothetical protein
MAGLKQLYKERDRLLKAEALESVSSDVLQKFYNQYKIGTPFAGENKQTQYLPHHTEGSGIPHEMLDSLVQRYNPRYESQTNIPLKKESLERQLDVLGIFKEMPEYDHDYDIISNKGRNGDSELREVDGQMAHVTQGEASLIDILGESVMGAIKERGAGTINPSTGSKEYHNKGQSWKHRWNHNVGKGHSGPGTYDEHGNVRPKTQYNEQSELTKKITSFGGNISNEDAELYFGDIYDDTEKEFVKEESELAQRSLIDKTKGQMRGVMSQADKAYAQSGFETNTSLDRAITQAKTDISSGFNLGMEGLNLGLGKSLFDISKSQDKEFFSRLIQAEQAGLL